MRADVRRNDRKGGEYRPEDYDNEDEKEDEKKKHVETKLFRRYIK